MLSWVVYQSLSDIGGETQRGQPRTFETTSKVQTRKSKPPYLDTQLTLIVLCADERVIESCDGRLMRGAFNKIIHNFPPGSGSAYITTLP